MTDDTYIKDGVEYYKANDVPSNNGIMTNVKQALTVADWEMGHFDGQVSTDIAEALVKHLKERL